MPFNIIHRHLSLVKSLFEKFIHPRRSLPGYHLHCVVVTVLNAAFFKKLRSRKKTFCMFFSRTSTQGCAHCYLEHLDSSVIGVYQQMMYRFAHEGKYTSIPLPSSSIIIYQLSHVAERLPIQRTGSLVSVISALFQAFASKPVQSPLLPPG